VRLNPLPDAGKRMLASPLVGSREGLFVRKKVEGTRPLLDKLTS
jgi:hypothetical protein